MLKLSTEVQNILYKAVTLENEYMPTDLEITTLGDFLLNVVERAPDADFLDHPEIFVTVFDLMLNYTSTVCPNHPRVQYIRDLKQFFEALWKDKNETRKTN
jgi:hypothetical protein